MGTLIAIVLLGIPASLDNLCVGISYGMMGRHVRVLDNLIVSGVSGVTAYIACAAAGLISAAGLRLTAVVGPAVFILLGLVTIAAALRENRGARRERRPARRRRAGRFAALFVLGIALALNGIAEAFGAGLTGLPAVPLALSVTLFSALCLGLGGLLGKKVRTVRAGLWLNVLSGAILIGVGVFQLLGW